MGRKSPVSGVAGAVRVQRLSGVSLAAAEAHGKRLDTAGKARSIIEDAPPITTSGLDLASLYEAHITGAKVQKSHTKALHLVLQFPRGLVDGEDGEMMLGHARAFVTSIFGPSAIFADRVDRDEKSRHVVDLFLAPRYEKVTKRQTQAAISTSKHLKDLAAERGKAPNLRGQGQALQDAWFEYLRDQMRLDVARGDPKEQPGEDWQSPEGLELERLREERAALEAQKRAAAAELERLAEAQREAAEALEATKGQEEALQASLRPLQAAVRAMDVFQGQMDDYEVQEAEVARETKDAFQIVETRETGGEWVTSSFYAEPMISVRAESHATGEETSWSFPYKGEESPGMKLHRVFQAAKKAGNEMWVRVTGWSQSDKTKPTGLSYIDRPPAPPKKPTIAREVLRLLARLDDRSLTAIRELDQPKPKDPHGKIKLTF